MRGATRARSICEEFFMKIASENRSTFGHSIALVSRCRAAPARKNHRRSCMKTTTPQQSEATVRPHETAMHAAAGALSRAAVLDRLPGSLPDAALRYLPPLAATTRYASESVADVEELTAVPGEATGLTAAQEALLLEALPLVRFVARGIHERLPSHVELDELISAGTPGLVDAARKFNPSKNVLFRSYAQFRIRGAILDSLRSLDWSPRELRRKGRALQEARRTLEARLNRMATDAELATEMEITLEALQQLTGTLRGLEVSTLHAERSEDSGEEELAFLPAREEDNPLFRYLEGEARERVMAAIDALPERERLVILFYYFEEMTMREIGMVLGVVESRVSQIHHETLRRLRSTLGGLRKPLVRATAGRRASA
jgi:RNA polymerase sigma factor for flagellar operon FliA